MQKTINKMPIFKDIFYDLFRNPTREGVRTFFLEQTGEQDNIDFKQDWPEFPKLAKIILGMSNSYQNGLIIIGVEEKDDGTYDPIGINQIRDKAEVFKGLKSYIPDELKYDIIDICYDVSEYEKLQGKKFQLININPDDEEIPYLSKKEGNGITNDVIYVRRGTSTEKANATDIDKIINRRIFADEKKQVVLTLESHLSQLKTLFGELQRKKTYSLFSNIDKMSRIYSVLSSMERENVLYPKEDYEHFIVRLISQKKEVIEKVLGIPNNKSL